MKHSGEIDDTDWKLFLRDEETGRAALISWGDEHDAKAALEREINAGRDAWLVPAADHANA